MKRERNKVRILSATNSPQGKSVRNRERAKGFSHKKPITHISRCNETFKFGMCLVLYG